MFAICSAQEEGHPGVVGRLLRSCFVNRSRPWPRPRLGTPTRPLGQGTVASTSLAFYPCLS